MIRKVPDMAAWVMHFEDYQWWYPTSDVHLGFDRIIQLPLFDTFPEITHWWRYSPTGEELILVVDIYVNPRPFTLKQVDDINKTWNLFYE